MRERRNRFSLDLFSVLQSKKRMKVIGNLAFLILALIFLTPLFLWTYQPQILDGVGSWMVSSYKNQFETDWRIALQQLRAGKTQPAIELLETKKWQEIQNRDRIYPMKRKLLNDLTERLQIIGQYEALLYWSAIWRNLDERDVTAMAYWYEALRHTADRREEGVGGLEREWQRFPSNEALTRFHAVALVESGNSIAAEEMRTKHRREVMNAMSKGWRVAWNWRIQQALERPIYIELPMHLRNWELISVWHDVVGISRLLWSWRGDDRLKRTGLLDFSISTDDKGWVEVPIRIPAFVTTLRIDPPPGSKVQISDIQIVFNDVTHSISISQLVDQRHFKRMVRKGQTLESRGADDPWVRMNIVDIISGSERKAIDVVLRFRAAILIPDL